MTLVGGTTEPVELAEGGSACPVAQPGWSKTCATSRWASSRLFGGGLGS